MQIFVFALAAAVAVSANAQPVGETGGPLSIKVCEPGHFKMEDCNTCLCDTDGSGYACTKKICPIFPTGTCEPGEDFKYYCNTCTCPADGLRENAICTLMGCLGVWNEDGTQLSDSEALGVLKPRTKRQACRLGEFVMGSQHIMCRCEGNPARFVCGSL